LQDLEQFAVWSEMALQTLEMFNQVRTDLTWSWSL
jgi:hypothetical protein